MTDNNRQPVRIRMDSHVFIELESPEVDGEGQGEIARCKTTDISRGGLQVGLDRELAVGAILQIGVELPGAEDAFYMAGEVKWCRPDAGAEGSWIAGFQLLNASDSDIERWRSLLTLV